MIEITARQIIRETATKYNTTLEQMRGPRKLKNIARARMECYYRLRVERKWTYPQIARRFNKECHTTCIHGVKRHAHLHDLPLPPTPVRNSTAKPAVNPPLKPPTAAELVAKQKARIEKHKTRIERRKARKIEAQRVRVDREARFIASFVKVTTEQRLEEMRVSALTNLRDGLRAEYSLTIAGWSQDNAKAFVLHLCPELSGKRSDRRLVIARRLLKEIETKEEQIAVREVQQAVTRKKGRQSCSRVLRREFGETIYCAKPTKKQFCRDCDIEKLMTDHTRLDAARIADVRHGASA